MGKLGRAVTIVVLHPSLLLASAITISGLLRRNIIDRQVVARLVPYLDEVYIMYFAIAVLFGMTYTVMPLAVSLSAALMGNEPLSPKNPRLQRQRLAGLPGRLYSAQQNLAEGFPGFLGALFSATFCKVSPTIRVQLALLHVICRILYVMFYAMEAMILRIFTWMLGVGACYALFGFAIVPGFAGRVEAFGDRFAGLAASLPIGSLLARIGVRQ